jgi:DNA-3-methyladenine glycosylase
VSKYNTIDDKFFENGTIETAKSLLGKIIVKNEGENKYLAGKIVETEAYLGENDPACHAYLKTTGRSRVLYEEAGTIYVYFIYGNYYCFNVVTERKGIGAAVLIRAVEPIEGIDIMKKNRKNVKREFDLTNGPSKFCMAFGIGKEYNEKKLSGSGIFIAKRNLKEKFEIVVSKRIGIVKGADLPYRFFIKNNPYVTKHKFNNI